MARSLKRIPRLEELDVALHFIHGKAAVDQQKCGENLADGAGLNMAVCDPGMRDALGVKPEIVFIMGNDDAVLRVSEPQMVLVRRRKKAGLGSRGDVDAACPKAPGD